jgi:tRNA(Arg) A34 adenosine deaminase TadA
VWVDTPEWVNRVVDWERAYATDEEKMRLAIALSRENVRRGTGGPFGAAVFEVETGRLVAVGANSVVRLNNCALHAEMVAFMLAQRRRGSFTLGGDDMPAHELVTSCEPCAMCLGGALWSGVARIVWGAGNLDARRIGFDEGPVFSQSYEYLRQRGIELVPGVLRGEAVEVLNEYAARSGPIYNGMASAA